LLVGGLVTAYIAALTAAATLTRIHSGDLQVFGVLLGCMIVSVEITRRGGEPSGLVRDVYAIWDLPVAVLLPPLYTMLLTGARLSLTQLRVRRTVIHRRAYTAAAFGLAGAAASVIFHAAAPVLGGAVGTSLGLRALLWILLAAGCGIVRVYLGDALILTAVWGVDRETSVRSELFGAEVTVGNTAELCLGLLVTFAAARSVLVVLCALPLVIWQQRSVRHNQLVAAARVDRKTGLLNDPTWRSEAAAEVARAAQANTPVAVGILDVDHFKRVNDTYGHLAGDYVLAKVAAAAKAQLREYDLVGRIGGEEFAFVLTCTPMQAVEVAERVRQAIPGDAIPEVPDAGPDSPRPSGVTVSIGVAAAGQVTWSLDEFLIQADRALYAAKGNGRNRVFVITADPQAQGDLRSLPCIAAGAPSMTSRTIGLPVPVHDEWCTTQNKLDMSSASIEDGDQGEVPINRSSKNQTVAWLRMKKEGSRCGSTRKPRSHPGPCWVTRPGANYRNWSP
jgi:diguanylate cyclase (GGDEF)-like protein